MHRIGQTSGIVHRSVEMAYLIVFIIHERLLLKPPKSQSIRASHQKDVLEHLKHGERANGATTNFSPFNFLISARQFCLYCQKKYLDVKSEPERG